MQILIIRHGESEADILHVHEGRADYGLTARGHAQARALANRLLGEYKIDKIYTSSLKRARQTASYLAAGAGVIAALEDDLMEFNNGQLAGLAQSTADETYPEEKGLPAHQGAYKQESRLEFRFRAERMLSRILSENGENDVVAVVTHGGMINQLYQAYLAMPVNGGAAFPTGDTGLHRWVIKNSARYVAMSNDTSHLAQLDENAENAYPACVGI